MSHNVPTEESQETAALYALGALSQHEARAFEVHLRQGCEICERELREFTGVVDALSAGASEAAPPAYLRDLLGARIEKESSRPSTDAAEAQVYQFPDRVTERPQTTPVLESRSTLWTGWLPWAVAACLLVAFAYSFINWRAERRQLQTLAGRQADAERQVGDLREQLAREDARATREMEQIHMVLHSPQHSVIAMAGLEAAPNASANIYWDHQKNRWVVTASLPPAPAGKVYQLWVVTTDAKVSAGLIQPDSRGHGFVVVDLPAGVSQMQAAAITLEPQGGSPQPTLPIYVLGKVSA